jgi:hypothetical protein
MHFYYDEDLNVYRTVVDAVQSKKKCLFYYHDDVYLKANWKIEPQQSLQELYKLRAQQIRDDYPYVILCYSGGSDSTAVLETFYYNNIHIDEILMVGALSQDPHDESDKNQNGCLYHNAFPLLKTLNLPNTKITTLDYTELFRDGTINDFSLIKQYGNEWMKHTGVYHSVTHLFWHDLKRIVGAYNAKETAVVFGTDKVIVNFDAVGPHVEFGNQSFCDYGDIYDSENFHRVNFFSSGENTSVNIMIKQAHVVERVMRECYRLNIRPPDLKDVLYKYINKPSFVSKKCVYPILSPRDTFIISKQDSEIFKAFNEGKNFLKRYLPVDSRTIINSRKYYIK